MMKTISAARSQLTGYAHPAYAASLTEFGTPLELVRSRGWLLARDIPGHAAQDAMGCYPLFACCDWSALPMDLDALRDRLVSVVLVTDPFGDYQPADLQAYFDVVNAFKQHFVLDLRADASAISAHHRYYARHASKTVHVERCADPAAAVDEWWELYANLVRRHGLTNIQAFSRAAFVAQLSVPGVVLFRAVSNDRTVGAQWFYIQDDVAYSHLTALNERGYTTRAAYALQWAAIVGLRAEAKWLDLGAGAGLQRDARDGLTQFKRGWATNTRTAYLCGKILDAERYEQILNARETMALSYFPAYRRGEFK